MVGAVPVVTALGEVLDHLELEVLDHFEPEVEVQQLRQVEHLRKPFRGA